MSIIKTEHLVHNYIIKTSTMDINTIQHVSKGDRLRSRKRGTGVDHWDVQDAEKEYLSYTSAA